jgi:DNA-binding transcriptional MerR regulator
MYLTTSVTRHLGITANTLKKWTDNWAALQPQLNAKGKAQYSESQLQLLEQLKVLIQEQKMDILQAREQVWRRAQLDQYKKETLPKLKELRQFLLELQTKVD